MNPAEVRTFSAYRKPFTKGAVKEVVTKMTINSTDCLLDVGCGSGDLIKALVEETSVRQVLALDINQGMIDFAKDVNSDPRIQYFQSDAGNPDSFNVDWNNTFDKAVCYYVLMFIKNWESVTLRGIYDCLKPGGRAFINVGLKSSHCYQAVMSSMDIPEWKHYFTGYEYPLYVDGFNKDDFANILRKVGFKILSCDFEVRDFITNDDDTAMRYCRLLTHHMCCIPAEKRDIYWEDLFQHYKSNSKKTDDGQMKWQLDVITVVVEK